MRCAVCTDGKDEIGRKEAESLAKSLFIRWSAIARAVMLRSGGLGFMHDDNHAACK